MMICRGNPLWLPKILNLMAVTRWPGNSKPLRCKLNVLFLCYKAHAGLPVLRALLYASVMIFGSRHVLLQYKFC